MSTLTLTAADIARLGATIPARTRIADPEARERAKATKEKTKRAALAEAAAAAERFHDYTPAQLDRIDALRAIHWPRVRAIRDALANVNALLARHADKHDDLSLAAHALSDEFVASEANVHTDAMGKRHDVTLENTIYRQCRLEHLLSRAYAASAAIGRFPVSRHDMRTDKRTRFIGSAAKRHFTFAGGRDWGTLDIDPADIVQGAFLRAIEAGDTVSGVPTFGSMFRWIQAERARLTNLANAEYSARKRAALGWTESAADEYQDTTHTLRLLDTRNYATTADHRAAQAIAHRDVELARMDDYATRDARESEIGMANADEFHVVLAEYLMAGHALADVARALGLTVETVSARAIKSREDSLRRMSTGIDHAQRSLDIIRADEREREIDLAQARHAETLRARRVTAETAHYAMSR